MGNYEDLFLKKGEYTLLRRKDWLKLLALLNNHKEMLEFLDRRLIDLREDFEKHKRKGG